MGRLFVGLGVVIIVGVGIFYIIPRVSPPSTPVVSDPNKSPYSTSAPQEQPSSRYIEYSPEAFAAASASRRVLFFYAPWCPTCRPADTAFSQSLSQIPPDVILFRTSYDNETDLKRQYNVTYQHTFVQVDETGRVVTKWNGGDLAALQSNLK